MSAQKLHNKEGWIQAQTLHAYYMPLYRGSDRIMFARKATTLPFNVLACCSWSSSQRPGCSKVRFTESSDLTHS